MYLLKAVGWVFVLVVAGLAGSMAIFSISNTIIGSQVPVHLSSGPYVGTESWDQGVVYAGGTFTIDNDRSAFPLQVTKIRCVRDENTCSTATAEISFGEMLEADLSVHEIKLWNETTILYEEDALCVSYLYTIDRANKRVVGTRKSKQNVAGCEDFEKTPNLSLSLVNGFDIWWRLNTEAVARVVPFMWGGVAIWWCIVLLAGWQWRPRRTLSSATR
jgi:hypothetical protein